MSTPLITIFVRHSPGCKYAGEEFEKRCKCPKHFRWSLEGRQIRRAAGTRSWEEADRKKRILEDNIAGNVATKAPEVLTLRAAIETFIQSREVKGVDVRVVQRYRFEMGRFADFAEKHNVFTLAGITLPFLIKYRSTWPALYESTNTQSSVQKRLRAFLHFCLEAEWITRVPKMDTVQIDEPPTMPLTTEEYERLLAAVPEEFTNGSASRVRAIIQLMRWSGLAVRDACMLLRNDIACHAKGVYQVRMARQKTGVYVRVPIPPAVASEILAVWKPGAEHIFYISSDCTPVTFAQKRGKDISRCFERAGIRSLGHMISHRLRDTFAVDLLEKGVPLEDVSKLLGHESISTTEKHYAKWVKGRQDRLTNLVTATWEAK